MPPICEDNITILKLKIINLRNAGESGIFFLAITDFLCVLHSNETLAMRGVHAFLPFCMITYISCVILLAFYPELLYPKWVSEF